MRPIEEQYRNYLSLYGMDALPKGIRKYREILRSFMKWK